jgi:hypothetical protein
MSKRIFPTIRHPAGKLFPWGKVQDKDPNFQLIVGIGWMTRAYTNVQRATLHFLGVSENIIVAFA